MHARAHLLCQHGGNPLVIRLGCRHDEALLAWRDGLQAVLAAHIASRLFTTEGHISWIRALIDAVSKDGLGSVPSRRVPALFAAANLGPPAQLQSYAAQLAISAPLRYPQVESLIAKVLTGPTVPTSGMYRMYAGDATRMSRTQWMRFCAEEQGDDEHVATLLFAMAVDQAQGHAYAPPSPPSLATRGTLPTMQILGDSPDLHWWHAAGTHRVACLRSSTRTATSWSQPMGGSHRSCSTPSFSHLPTAPCALPRPTRYPNPRLEALTRHRGSKL